MTSRILATASVVAIAFGTATSAQELPTWNPQTICTEDSTPQHCRFLEGQARAHISQQWEFMPSRVRARCLSSTEEQESESWRVFADCLADAAKKPANGDVQVAGGEGSGVDSALNAELEAAKARIAELEANAGDDGARDRVAELEAELAKATTSVRSSEVRIDGLQQRLLAAINAQDAAGDADSDDDAQSARIAELEAELAKATTSARSSEVRIEGLQQRLLAAVDAQDAAGDDAQDARIAELEAELAKATTSARSSEVRIDGLQQRLLSTVDAQQDGADALQGALDKAEARARGAEFRSKALQATLLETIARSKAAKDDGEQSAARITELEGELDAAQTEAKRGLARIEGLQGRLMEMQDNASEGDDSGAAAQIADLQARLAVMQEISGEEREQHRARIADLEEQLVKSMKEVEAASAGSDEEMTAKVADLEAKLSKAQASTRSGEVRIEGLQQRLMAAMDREAAQGDGGGGSDSAALQGQLATAQSRIENLQSRLSSSRAALKNAERDGGVSASNLANARTRIAALQDAMIENRRAAAAAAAAEAANNADDGEQVQRLQTMLDNQRERAGRIGEKVAEQRGRIRELEGEVRSLRRVAKSAGSVSCQQRMNDVVSAGGIQFANNKTDIRADAAQTIDRLISIAQDCNGRKITVKGHTDTSGERSYNLQLSQRRADAVAAYMERKGIDAGRINAVGVGPDEPIADNNTRAGRTQNRRIEIVIE